MSAVQKSYIRFSVAQRLEHFILILSFSILGLTGLPQKYPLSPISTAVVQGLGGIESIRVIHRIAATVFLLESIYHLAVVGYSLFVQRRQASMLPGLKDLQDAIQVFMYNLGLGKHEPKMERFNFVEKAEYWAMLWGLFVMAVTGFMLWNPIATTKVLPGVVIPAAKVAHGGEAVLAVLAIILWHFYGVHIKRFNTSMFNGKMDRKAMEEEHGLELARIESGAVPPLPSPDFQRQRMMVFAPVMVIFTLAMLGGVYWFVSFEESAITTVPPVEQAEVFSPATSTPTSVPTITPTPAPTNTPAPTKEGQVEEPQVVTIGWKGELDAVFKTKCGTCHGASGGFSAGSYADVMKGIKPGNAEESSVYSVQVKGHPGKFSDEELAKVKEWIEAGAPEEAGTAAAGESSTTDGGGSTTTGGSSVAATWEQGVRGMLASKCGACHGKSGGFSVKTYEDTVKQIKLGDPDGSKLVEVMKGTHPRTLTDEELAQVIEWIKAGAPK